MITLPRRIARLEAMPPVPPDPPRRGDDDWDAFRRHCPSPVLAYFAAIEREEIADAATDAAGVVAWLDTAHPALTDVIAAVRPFADKGDDAPVAAVHHALLSRAFIRLEAHFARNGWGGYAPGTTDAAWRAAYGIAGDTRREGHRGDTGAGWAQLWRTRGTTDPATRAIMGLHGPELTLLAAQEDI